MVQCLMANTNESSLAEGIGYQPGEEIGRYEVVARIAIGGQSIIYKCHDPALDRLVAIKQISTHLAEDKMFLDRFRTEAQILARLGAEQPEVVTIHDLLENRQGLFIVMEFIDGISIERTLASNPGPVELKATLQILWRLCSALHTVHSAGVIHRDIKPSNIIIADGLRPMITDFGVAATSSGEASMVMGTTKYMAPELFTGGYVDGRADMYSLGFIAYEMLVGREKFNEIFADIVRDRTAEKVRWMKWHSNPKVSAPPPHEVNAAIPVTLSNIVLRMIAKDSEQRFAGMEDLGRAIKQTFRPGAKAGGAPVPIAPPVDGETVSISGDREALPFDTEDVLTAPIPKRKFSLRAKVSMAVAALLLLVGGLVVRGMMQGRDIGETEAAAKEAYRAARDVYKSDRDYAAAEEKFLAVRKNFERTIYAEPSKVYIHMCRAHLAVRSEDWSRAQTEQESAADLTLKIQKQSDAGGVLYKWTVTMKESIKDFDNYRLNRKAFAEAMASARKLYNESKYDKAVSDLTDLYDDAGRLEDDQQKKLSDFKEKVVRKQGADECDALMAAARQANSGDAGTALATWEKASAGLQRLKPHIDAAKWLRMTTDVEKAQAKLTKNKRLRDIMAVVNNARQSGDNDRLLRALRAAMVEPGVPPELVQRWAAEIKSIQESVDFSKVTRLLVSGDTKGAIDALNAFIEKYPKNHKAKVIKEGLEKKEVKILARKEAFRLFDRGRWAEALEKLKILRQDRGDREVKEKMRYCQYKLEMVAFDAAVKAGDYAKAEAAGERARTFNPDAWDTEIDPKLVAMRARKKVADTLAKGEAALKNKQYSEVRKILDHLKDAYPEAKTMIRQSRYRGSLAMGDTAKLENDIKRALAMYKIAKNYAKDPAEHKEIDALISAATQALGGS